MSIYVRWAGPGLKRVSAQPVSNYLQAEAVKFIDTNGGETSRREVFAHLMRSGVPEQEAKNVITMLPNFGFATPVGRSRIATSEWASKLIGRSQQKEDNLIGLAMGVISGGFSKKILGETGETSALVGTRLILSTLLRFDPQRPDSKVTLEDLCEEMNESGKVSVFCVLEMLGLPSKTQKGGDPLALGIISRFGSGRNPKECLVKLNKEILLSYQMSILSRYLGEAVPKLVHQKYGVNLQSAIDKKFDMLSADALRGELQSFPPIWLSDGDLDSLLLKVTQEYGYDWWAEDARGGSRGLLGNQKFAYMKVTRDPRILRLRNPFHAMF